MSYIREDKSVLYPITSPPFPAPLPASLITPFLRLTKCNLALVSSAAAFGCLPRALAILFEAG